MFSVVFVFGFLNMFGFVFGVCSCSAFGSCFVVFGVRGTCCVRVCVRVHFRVHVQVWCLTFSSPPYPPNTPCSDILCPCSCSDVFFVRVRVRVWRKNDVFISVFVLNVCSCSVNVVRARP